MLGQKKYLTEKHAAQIREEVQAELEEALAFAESSLFPEPEDAMADLYSNS
jgi:TPP-dependent pyruvate/acetoin dehydrogenase alpha subunit